MQAGLQISNQIKVGCEPYWKPGLPFDHTEKSPGLKLVMVTMSVIMESLEGNL